MKTSSIFLSAGLIVASVAASASAQVAPPKIVTHVAVAHGDLDLESDSGVRTMLNRLDKATTKACGGKPLWLPGDSVGSARRHEFRRCKAAAMDSSTKKLRSQLVRAAWLRKGAPSTIRTQEALKVAHDDVQSFTR